MKHSLEDRNSRFVRAEAYIRDLVPNGWTDDLTATRALSVLSEILKNQVLPVPDVAPGPDGIVGFVWRTTEHYLTLEVHRDDMLEFFHNNFKTCELWSEDASSVSSDFVKRLIGAFE